MQCKVPQLAEVEGVQDRVGIGVEEGDRAVARSEALCVCLCGREREIEKERRQEDSLACRNVTALWLALKPCV